MERRGRLLLLLLLPPNGTTTNISRTMLPLVSLAGLAIECDLAIFGPTPTPSSSIPPPLTSSDTPRRPRNTEAWGGRRRPPLR